MPRPSSATNLSPGLHSRQQLIKRAYRSTRCNHYLKVTSHSLLHHTYISSHLRRPTGLMIGRQALPYSMAHVESVLLVTIAVREVILKSDRELLLQAPRLSSFRTFSSASIRVSVNSVPLSLSGPWHYISAQSSPAAKKPIGGRNASRERYVPLNSRASEE